MPEYLHDAVKMLQLLQSKLNPSAELELVGEGAHSWVASFTFGSPVEESVIERVKARWQLPTSYELFLRTYNGAKLYYDTGYGQWGFQLYQAEELIPENDDWLRLYDGLPRTHLVFGQSYGDSDLLVLDTTRQTKIPNECSVLDGDTGYPVNTWESMARSFGEWINYLVVVQGAKYWRWYR